MSNKIIIKRHNGFKVSEMKRGTLFIKGKSLEFKVIKSLGKRYLILQDEAISFKNFDELFQKLKERNVQIIRAYDKYGKAHATIVL
jgi:hypothetical protein